MTFVRPDLDYGMETRHSLLIINNVPVKHIQFHKYLELTLN